jgi:lipoprotein NlpD
MSGKRLASSLLGFVLVALLAGCGSRVPNRAPVEDRGAPLGGAAPNSTAASAPVKPLPGSENDGKPGYYTVRPGDTVMRIALDHGQAWRDIVRWNQLDNPNLIEVGQVLRVVPPGAVVDAPGVVSRPIVSSSVSPLAVPSPGAGASVSPGAATPAAPTASAPSAGTGDEAISFTWPVGGAVLAAFDESRNKGLDLAGKAGDPVHAAADGRVVYAGAGLRGYGNLIILKHNNTYLTAYAHNQTLLVKEDQQVRKGQRIAEMGSSDADRVKLHFEIRRQGKPVDPARYLPAR